MRITFTPQLYTQNTYKNNIQNQKVSFGAKATDEALEYLKAIGVDTSKNIDTNFVETPEIVPKVLSNIVKGKGKYSSMTVNELTDRIKFFGASEYLPESYKAKFIINQLIGHQGETLRTIIDLSGKLPDKDKNDFRRALVYTYIHGASHNSKVDLINTYRFLNQVTPFMDFKEQCYTRQAIQACVQ